jgi:hypothetical protein
MCSAFSWTDNSLSSRSWMALRIAGFNCAIAEDRIRAPSVWKQLTGRTSASSRAGVVSPELLECAAFPQQNQRFVNGDTVKHVEKADFPSNRCKWTNAFWKVCWTTSSASSRTRV